MSRSQDRKIEVVTLWFIESAKECLGVVKNKYINLLSVCQLATCPAQAK